MAEKWKLTFYSHDCYYSSRVVHYFDIDDEDSAKEEFQQRYEWSFGDNLPAPKLEKVKTDEM